MLHGMIYDIFPTLHPFEIFHETTSVGKSHTYFLVLDSIDFPHGFRPAVEDGESM